MILVVCVCVWGGLPLCREAVGVFYSPNRLGKPMIVTETIFPKLHRPSRAKTMDVFCCGWSSGPSVRKFSYRILNSNPNQKLRRCENTVHITIFNIGTLNHHHHHHIPNPLSPLLPIVHHLWQVFRTTSRILT